MRTWGQKMTFFFVELCNDLSLVNRASVKSTTPTSDSSANLRTPPPDQNYTSKKRSTGIEAVNQTIIDSSADLKKFAAEVKEAFRKNLLPK